ncbi:MAG TPA: plastocyanin/azurin family copper-binding protein [Acidimicrobiales bacterium]
MAATVQHRPAAPDAEAGGPGSPAPDASAVASGVAEVAPGPAVPAPPGRAGSGRRAWVRRVAVVALVAATVTGAGYGYEAVARDPDPAPPALGPGDVTVEVGIEHSLFTAEEIRVVEGTRVRFVVDNGDPIGHELITGPPDVHARHARGTEAEHPSIPGEVSVGPGDVGITTFTFDEPGEYEFACHLPGHYEYGMHGTVVVEPAD